MSSSILSENRDSQITLTQDDERAPLLGDSKVHLPSGQDSSLSGIKWQLFILSFARFAEGVTLTTTLPFVNHMIEDLGVTRDPEKVGYYVGLIESSFSFAQFFTVFQWGRLSDVYGRKPVIVTSLLAVSLASVWFGLSKSYSSMIMSRVMAGTINGNIGAVKSMIGELTTEHNQAKAFAFLMVCWSCGAIIGPLIGGYLAQPAKRYPDWFGPDTKFGDFYVQYPYILPTAVASVLPLITIFIVTFFGKETLPLRRSSNPSNDDAERSRSLPPSKRGLRAVLTRQTLLLALNYLVLAFQAVCLQSLFTLFCYTPVLLGGVGFDVQDIGKALSLVGFCQMLSQMFLFPILHRILGTIRVYRTAMLIFPVAFALFPVCNAVARRHYITDSVDYDRGQNKNEDYKHYVWPVLSLLLSLRVLAELVWAALIIMVNDSSPSRSLLGSLNGFSQSAASLGRGLGPMSATSLFALSIDYNLAGGRLIWYVMIAWTSLGVGCSWLVDEVKPKWRQGTKERDDEVLVARAEALEGEEAII